MHSILDAALGPWDSNQPILLCIKKVKVLNRRGIGTRVGQIIECYQTGISIDDICKHLEETWASWLRSPFGQNLVADGYEFSSMPQELHTQPLYKIMPAIGCMEGLMRIIKDLPPPGPLWRCTASFMVYLSLFLPKFVTGESACSQKAFQQLEKQGD